MTYIKTKIEHLITYQESDYKNNLKMVNLFSWLSDLATSNAVVNGIWKDEYHDLYGFVLLKQTLVLNKQLKLNDLLEISTLPVGGKRAKFYRAYDLILGGELVGAIFSVWTLIDLQRRRIIKPSKVGLNIEEGTYQGLVNEYIPIKDIPVTYIHSRMVHYSDIDPNNHMNNARYLEWVYDALKPEILMGSFIKELSMDYKKEITLNDQIDILIGYQDDYFKCVFLLKDNQEICFEIGGYFNV